MRDVIEQNIVNLGKGCLRHDDATVRFLMKAIFENFEEFERNSFMFVMNTGGLIQRNKMQKHV